MIGKFVCIYICIYKHLYMYACIRIYVYIYVHIHVYIGGIVLEVKITGGIAIGVITTIEEIIIINQMITIDVCNREMMVIMRLFLNMYMYLHTYIYMDTCGAQR
jgi:hypothetical protein